MLYRAILVQLLMTFTLVSRVGAQTSSVPQSFDIDYTAPAHYLLEDIQIVGNKYIDKELILGLLGFRAGDTIYLPGPVTTEVVRRIWKQGLVEDVSIYVSHTTDRRIILTISITERPRLSAYSLEGISKKDQSKLREKLVLVQGKAVTDELTQNTEKTIKDFFTAEGYLNTTVTITSIPDATDTDSIQLKIKIDKGTRQFIHTVQLEGNHHIGSDALKAKMKHVREKPRFTLVKDILRAVLTLQPVRKQGILWRPVSLEESWGYLRKHVILFPSSFVPAQFEEDKKRILSYYQSKGFRDAILVEAIVDEQSDSMLHVLLKVKEGKKYRIGDIKWTGNYLYDDSTLQQVLNIKRGEVYDPLLLQSRLYNDPEGQDVTSLYADDGYSFFQANSVEVGLEGDLMNLEIRIQEGPQVRINKILIEGNKYTHDHVIRRELRTLPGDKLSRSKLKRSYRELAQLNIFDPAIDISPIPNMADKTVDIKYKVRERPKFETKLSGGWGRGWIGSLGLFTNNFSLSNLWKARTPIGGGQTVGISAETDGKEYGDLSLQFADPWLGGKKPRYFHLSLGIRSQEGTSRSIGGDTGLGTRLTWLDDYVVLKGRLAYYHHRYNDYQFFDEDDNRKCSGILNDLSAHISLERDSTGPNPVFPKEGSKVELHANLTPPWSWLLGENYNRLPEPGQYTYTWKEHCQWMLDSSYFLQLSGDLVLNCRAHFGILNKFSSQERIGPFERFVLGGSGFRKRTLRGEEQISLRGYEEDYVVPKDAVTNHQGGVIYDKFVLELRYPVISSYIASAYILAFAEGGNTWSQYEDYNLFALKRSVGVGFRVYLPFIIGTTIGFDLGYGFDKKATDPKRGELQTHFSIGMGLR